MNVLMVGHTGVYNRGCEAIIRSSILILKKKYENLTVTLASFDYENDVKHDFGFPVKVVPHLRKRLWKKWSLDWVILKFGKLFGKNLAGFLMFRDINTYLAEADLVLSIGGDNYSEDYGKYTLSIFLELNDYAKDKAKKFIIWGASVGPFSDDGESSPIIKNLQAVDKILLREDFSLKYLEKIGLKNIARVADPAFMLTASEVKVPDFLLDKNFNKVGFNVSPLLGQYRTQENGVDIFRSETIKFLTALLSDEKVCVVLLPHVVDHKQGMSDDLHYLESIYRELPNKNRIFFPQESYNSEQLKYIISCCSFYLGARTHTTIASLSMKVPTISIGYSVKAQGINQDIFGHQDYVLESKKYSAEALSEKYALLKAREEQIRHELNEVIPRIKQLSLKALDVI